MRHVLGFTGVTAAAILLLVSAAMNWRFGYSLGKSEFESQLYGAASAAADCFKALLPFFIFAALRSKSWSQAFGGMLLLGVCFSYSLTSSLGFAAINRADTTGNRAIKAGNYQDLRGELTHAQTRLATFGNFRPSITVQSDIDGMVQQQSDIWRATKGCTDATIPKSMEYCGTYHKYLAEKGTSIEAEKLDTRVAELTTKISKVSGGDAVREADPQSAVLSTLSGASTEQVQLALTILVAFLVELGASMGFYVAFSFWGIEDAKSYVLAPAAPVSVPVTVPQQTALVPIPLALSPISEAPKSDVELFFDERVGREEGSSVMALTLYDDYCAWCEARGKQPLGLPVFNRNFSDLGVQKAKIAGRIRWLGIRMLFGDEEENGTSVTLASDNLRAPRGLMIAKG